MNNNLEYKELSNKSKGEIFSLFNTNENGLNQSEVSKRLDEYGDNIAINRKKKTPLFFSIEA